MWRQILADFQISNSASLNEMKQSKKIAEDR